MSGTDMPDPGPGGAPGGAPGSAPGAAPEPVATARTPGWVRGLLFTSLALNLLVLGILGGAILVRHDRQVAVWPRDPAAAIYLRALPQDAREGFVADLRREAPARRPSRAELRAELAATLAVIRAEAFEPDALMARIAAQRDRLAERVAAGDRLFVGRIAAMSLAERRAYADRLEAGLRHGVRSREE